MTFEEIRAQAESNAAPEGMYQYTMTAAINADDTIYVDKEADESEYDAIALATLELILCDEFIAETDAIAREYFMSLGVRF